MTSLDDRDLVFDDGGVRTLVDAETPATVSLREVS
jgi:hypothetical protein